MTTAHTDLPSTIELENGGDPTHTILWLHGLGADGNDFVPIIDELELPSDSRIRFIFPHAPMRPVSINNGFVMRAWYDVLNPNFSQPEDEDGLRDSQRAIEALLEREQQRGITPERIVLAGFSQGGAMALQTGLRYPERLAGIMALSCYLPLQQTLAAEAHHANSATSIFMAHGSQDSIVPLTLAAASRRQLLESGYAVEWHEYLMAHTVCVEEMTDISAWLKRVLI
ncbi:MAG: carboxylesterase [Nitrosomonadaceae bacterium]|nr:MAG: carboxylesterase [Nitrosomonadaceae bacterium]